MPDLAASLAAVSAVAPLDGHDAVSSSDADRGAAADGAPLRRRFSVQVSPRWTVLGKANGGYLLTILGRAAQGSGPHPDVLAASAHFLHAPDPGPAIVSSEVLRAGRSASQLRLQLEQNGRPCIEALFTTGTLADEATEEWNREPPADVATFEDCMRLPARAPDGSPVAIMDEVDLRLDPAVLGFATGRPSGRGELRGWLAALDGEPFSAVDLLYAADAFPPASFEIASSGWVPTLELTVYVRARPAAGPLRVRQRAGLITDDRLDETCEVWDAEGRLVAQGVQLAGIRLR
ncbi:MAG: thioesterase family protein [bacterium]